MPRSGICRPVGASTALAFASSTIFTTGHLSTNPSSIFSSIYLTSHTQCVAAAYAFVVSTAMRKNDWPPLVPGCDQLRLKHSSSWERFSLSRTLVGPHILRCLCYLMRSSMLPKKGQQQIHSGLCLSLDICSTLPCHPIHPSALLTYSGLPACILFVVPDSGTCPN